MGPGGGGHVVKDRMCAHGLEVLRDERLVVHGSVADVAVKGIRLVRRLRCASQ